MFIVNAILTVLTLGIYHFWAKANIRRYVYSKTELDGAPFAFHGTGKEMFLGWLQFVGIAFGFGIACSVVGAVFRFAMGPLPGMMATMIFFYMGLFLVMPYAIASAQQYRLSRTSYRGIHFSFRGAPAEFVRVFVKGALLSMVTFGFYTPYLVNNAQSFIINQTYYGDRRFEYDGKGDELFWMYVKAFFLTLITFGLYSLWFQAQQYRYMASHTRFGQARFESQVTGGDLFVLVMTNMLLFFCTLGLALPWIFARTIAFNCEHIALRGAIDFASIKQDKQSASAIGEAAADALAGGDLGI
jgi:uncharacterized membrane protein YjgN (DUF898 family)